MFSRVILAEIKWVFLALAISFFLLNLIDGAAFYERQSGFGVPQTFLGLNLFLEILVFFVFSAFVVFGVKGFFEMYSRKFANVIILILGIVMAVVIFILSYQILFGE
ncbi:hypothetical protein GV828_01530 [Flavobacterium sp. NST-5]|uniref:Uncharacterized protein n=1 Tax=Flavobacterium ichthyis TaxID=2698827 RepID=A0ABW9Z6Y4_9FLAO|nr:hypothetical protein [Flavobacterium ichthyis]NBL63875.1 hypothetical protein [Flavobacterium ichthyis]